MDMDIETDVSVDVDEDMDVCFFVFDNSSLDEDLLIQRFKSEVFNLICRIGRLIFQQTEYLQQINDRCSLLVQSPMVYIGGMVRWNTHERLGFTVHIG